ncbi:MAG: ribosome maturation factor RimP [Gammaproteobacteria bacterium]|nr:ribosome maturation factor RimP [Gammaproteobacteria bacterium]
MGQIEARLKAMLKPAVETLGYELVGLQYSRRRKRALLRAYIDKVGGVTLDDCERASHQISGVLDVEDPISEPFDLEVSSPGLDRPLFEPAHYERFAGHRVRIRLNVPIEGRRNFTGVLLGIRDGKIRLSDEGGERTVPFDAVGVARLIPAD